MWFKPPVGGWIGDHLSFAVGLAPAPALVMNGGRWSRWLAVLSGACLAYGFTLKLNNYGPADDFNPVDGPDVAWNHRVRWGAIARGAAWIAAGALPVALLFAGLYANVFRTYAAVLQSQANTRASWQRLLLLPLQIDLVSAMQQGQGGGADLCAAGSGLLAGTGPLWLEAMPRERSTSTLAPCHCSADAGQFRPGGTELR
jgi:hypothetical protein